MDIMKMMGQLKASQQEIEEAKKRMAKESLSNQSNDQLLKTTVFKDGLIKDISIADELLKDKEMLEDYLITTLNKALQEAKEAYEKEMANAAKKGLPNIPGMPFG